MSIDDLRRGIDAIDDQILELLDRRAAAARGIGELKQKNAIGFHDPERERRVIERLEQRLRARPEAVFPAASVRPVFREIISACLSLEETLTVAFLGPQGTFTHMAALGTFGLAPRYVEATTIAGVFDAVSRQSARYGVVPVENSSEGGVNFTLDRLLSGDLLIRGELVLDVNQCLLGHGPDLSAIDRVYSHPQALSQCREWLAANLPGAQLVVSQSTSAAAREAASDPRAAAVASRLAAEFAGLSVVRDAIQDKRQNATRFLILAQADAPATGRDKTSLVFSTPHQRGALKLVLEIFEQKALNLTRIESRPHPDRLWEYVFFTDLEGHRSDPALGEALEQLKTLCSMVKVLGSYPRAG